MKSTILAFVRFWESMADFPPSAHAAICLAVHLAFFAIAFRILTRPTAP